MDYKDIVSGIRNVALGIPTVNTWVDDIDRLNNYHDLKYGVVAMSPGLISIDDGYMTVNLSLYYIDRRFTEENENSRIRSEDNALVVQSRGIDILHVIVKKLPQYQYGLLNETYDVFNEQHLDDCVGARVDLALKVPYTYCPDIEII